MFAEGTLDTPTKKYDLFITNKRILLYRESGFINKSEDVICEKIERLQGLELEGKGDY
ncbi:MAG: hypothetical protein P0116_12905 [Candidatus Nitrosocosmicus sp.]|nr:hypothetical protein [Candidatus Nitrosocosmicus sp.]